MNKFVKQNALYILLLLPFVLAISMNYGLAPHIWLIASSLCLVGALWLTYKPAVKSNKLAYWLFVLLGFVFAFLFTFDWWLEVEAPYSVVQFLGIDGSNFLINGEDIKFYYYAIPTLVVFGGLVLISLYPKKKR